MGKERGKGIRWEIFFFFSHIYFFGFRKLKRRERINFGFDEIAILLPMGK